MEGTRSTPMPARRDQSEGAVWVKSADLDQSTGLAPWMEPNHLSSPAPWAGHIPFAAWLIATVKPRTLVELGVYSGISYLAFCQAAERFSVQMRAWGVDTWEGDSHAGHYSQQILEKLRQHHNPRYGHFSTLLQKTFDEALRDIPDGSVDLLHIDGLHTYEAVRHDFESWRSKLSDRAVVLFHDTEVRRDDFGVWRFWAEIRQEFPSLSFEHSNGLGILLVGSHPPIALSDLVEAPAEWNVLRQRLAALGERFELRSEVSHLKTAIADAESNRDRTRAELEATQQREHAQHSWIEQQDARLRELQQGCDVDAQSIVALQRELANRDSELRAGRTALEQCAEVLRQRDADVLTSSAQREVDARSIRDLQTELAKRDSELTTRLADLSSCQEALGKTQSSLADTEQALARARSALDELELARALSEREKVSAQALLSDQQRQLKEWHEQLTHVTRQARKAGQDLQAARSEAHALGLQVRDMMASRSWRMMAAPRKLGGWARRAKALLALQTEAATRRTGKALEYAAAGEWRLLVRRTRAVFRKSAEAQRLSQFEAMPAQSVRCGILATPHTWYVAHAVQVALQRAGLSADLVEESDGAYPLDLYFVICPQMFQRLPPGEKRIAFQMEQTVSSRWFTPEYLSVLENSLAALDYSRTNIANLAEYGIVYPHVYFIPIGGIAGYEKGRFDDAIPDEACDVLFYGDANAPRRRQMLDAIGQRFKLRIIGNAFGSDLHRAMAGAKVIVNLHYYEGALLETTRIYECLSLGKPVVSESAADQAEHHALDSVVYFTPLDDIPALMRSIEQVIQEQSTEAGRAAFTARCDLVVKGSQAHFEFMFNRMLLARRIIDYRQFRALDERSSSLSPRMALSLPETVARRAAFEVTRPSDVVVFDGLRYAPGWVGCALSYKYLAQTALSQGMPQIEIMEDDVVFPPDYEQRVARVHAHLASREGDWDVFVGTMALVHPGTRVLDVQRVDGETFVTLDRMISMVCNIYTPSMLQRIAEWDETWLDAEKNTIDRFLQTKGGLRAVVTLPFLVGHSEEMNSSLWGFSNAQYARLIAEAQAQVERLVDEFTGTRRDTV